MRILYQRNFSRKEINLIKHNTNRHFLKEVAIIFYIIISNYHYDKKGNLDLKKIAFLTSLLSLHIDFY